MDFKKGTFAAATGTGNQTISGLGFTPKGLIIWTSYQTAAGFTDTQGSLFQIGLADGTRQNSSYGRSDDNTSPNDCDQTRSTTQICLIRSGAGATIRAGTLSSFASGEFVINWSTVDAVAAIFHYVVVGGAEISVAVDALEADSSNGFVTTAVTFLPKAVFFVHAIAAGDFCSFPNIGWMARHEDNTIGQGANYNVVEDAQATSDVWRYQRTNRCANIGSTSTGAVFNDFSYNQLGLGFDTFTSNTTVFLHFLAIGGIRAFATSLLQPAATGNQAITGSGFTPKGLFVASVGQTAQTTVQTEARESLGAGDGTAQGWEFCGALDAVNPSVAVGGHNASNIVVMATPNATGASTTTEAQASLSSLDSNGFTLNWGTADATAREVIVLALGNAAVVGGESSHVF